MTTGCTASQPAASVMMVVKHDHTCWRFPEHHGDHKCPICGSRWLMHRRRSVVAS